MQNSTRKAANAWHPNQWGILIVHAPSFHVEVQSWGWCAGTAKTSPGHPPLTARMRRMLKKKEHNARGNHIFMRHTITPGNSSDLLFGSDFMDEEPSTMLTDDLISIKAPKCEWKHQYWVQLNKLKYQLSFLKKDPPFTYKGEIQVTLFKKWCCKVRDWIHWVRLSWQKAIQIAGKYLDGQADWFYKQNILDLQKWYSLTEFWGPLQLHLPSWFQDTAVRQAWHLQARWMTCSRFPPLPTRDHRYDQRCQWAWCALAFWHFCQSYLCVELTRNGYDVIMILFVVLELECLRYEKAHQIIQEDRNWQYLDNANR